MANGSISRKGKRWEREASKYLSKYGGDWNRIPGSGAMASQLGDASLGSDMVGRYPWWTKNLRGEAKYGYGGSKQMTLKRGWITKNREEAAAARDWPCLVLKFKGVTGGDIESAKLICFNFDTWLAMMYELQELYEENIKLLERLENVEER